MAVPLLGLHRKSQTNKIALLMERVENHNASEHVIDITSNSDASSSSSTQDRPYNGLEPRQNEDQPSTSVRTPVFQPSFSASNGSNTRNTSFVRRGNGHGRRRSPLNSGLWISIELVLTVSQIIASVVVLSLSRHEHPRAPLLAWIVGYASGCVATLPLLYWRYRNRNQGQDQDSSQARQGSPQSNLSGGSTTRTLEGEDRRTSASASRDGQSVGLLSSRLKVLVEYLKMALDCFFAVWFVVGNVWIFGGHSSSSDAPNLYREDLTENRGATPESINSLPTYKFKIKKIKNGSDSGAGEGGVIAAGTEKERTISGEDAVCCICLAKYANNDELRELPCSHFFHKDCVDKWLKINALCPLCKGEVGESILSSITEATANLQRSTLVI
ncbi:hypothetical protein RJ640_028696 [Escallonia rubra]|uniref:RING-type domain-containing protein n=1 Tax=Escallonia rubra TaxID=112253 RepID=A0AA88RJB4_9ASTE|nr:hypothetical protein RJ640_028696 [Escallonia rubra]